MSSENQSGGPIGPEQTSTPQSEIPHRSTLLKFSVPEDASQDEIKRIEDMNVLLKGFSIIGRFAESFKAQPIDEGELPSRDNPNMSERLSYLYQEAPSIIQISGRFLALVRMKNEDIDYQKLVIKDLTGEDPEVAGITEKVTQLKQDYADKINEEAEKYLSTDPEIKTISIKRSQIDSLEVKFRQAFHDMANPLNRIVGYMDLYSFFAPMEDQFTALNNALGSFVDSYDTLEKSLSDVYEKEKLSLEYILTTAKKILPHLNLRKSQIPKNLRDVIIPSWAEGWLVLLFGDIEQNINRSFDELKKASIERKEEVAIKFRRVDENGKKDLQGIYLEIDIEDNGIGIEPEVLGGFIEGLTNWGGSKEVGTGTAMASHAKVLHDQYGGELSAENVTENGVIKGARIKVRIPIQPQNS